VVNNLVTLNKQFVNLPVTIAVMLKVSLCRMKITVMRSFIAVLTFISLSFTALAQKGKIEGKITDAKTGLPVAGVSVILNGSKTGVSTNTDGYFVIAADAGKQSLNLSSTNYQDKKVDEIEVVAGQVAHLDIVMEVKAKTGETVIVRSSSAKKKNP